MPRKLLDKAPKPYSTFPLFAHRNGSWTKTIDGRHERFGALRRPDPAAYEKSWRDALLAFHRYEEAAAKGEQFLVDPRSVDVGTICDGYLTSQHAKADAKRIKGRTFAERRADVTEFRDAVGERTTVRELERDPASIRRHLDELDQRFGFHRFNNSMQRLRSMWKWAAHPNDGVLGGVPFRWIDLFKKREIREFRRQRRQEREAGLLLTFAPDELLALINGSRGPLRAMILLGYFAAYGNTDLGEMPTSALTVLEKDERIFLQGRNDAVPKGWGKLYFPRPKTELDRWAIIPPLVVDALAHAAASRPKPKLKADKNKQFLTAGGRPVCYEVEHRDEAGLIERVTVVDNVHQQWERYLVRFGRCEKHGWQLRKRYTRKTNADGSKVLFCPECDGQMSPMQKRGFYCLRHTATTRAAASGASSDTRNLFEGHTAGRDGGVRQTFYLDPTQLHDLLLIARDLAASIGLIENVQTDPAPPAAAPAPAAVA